MKLLVVGATGGIGREVVAQAVERGHAVTAFVRTPDALAALRDRITLVQGDLLDASALARVAEGHDAVLSSFGPRDPRAGGSLLQSFARALTDGLKRAEVRRLVIVSVAFLFKDSVIPPAYLAGRLLFGHHVSDAAAMETIVRESGLDWTIARPPALTNRPEHGAYRVREGHLPLFGFVISRAQVADFMLGAAENHSSVGKIVGISR
jgi:putative NADH-flavin reductase